VRPDLGNSSLWSLKDRFHDVKGIYIGGKSRIERDRFQCVFRIYENRFR
jgi:hypothetical protein